MAIAGSDSACVSRPRKIGPVMPGSRRCSQIACVVAAMWSSLNDSRSALPRWPEVPKATCCDGSAGSGCSVKYAVTSARDVHQVRVGRRLARPVVHRIAAFSCTGMTSGSSSARADSS